MTYLALLRGINVGGNNKVSMAELKDALMAADLGNVRTYINSGNVLFESQQSDIAELTALCERVIEDRFGFAVGCIVISSVQYKKIIDAAPSWWGTDSEHLRSDALFVMAKGTAGAVRDAVGEVNNEFEWLASQDNVVFWTVDMRKYGRARLPKIIGSDVYRTVSMRSASTTRKLYALLENS